MIELTLDDILNDFILSKEELLEISKQSQRDACKRYRSKNKEKIDAQKKLWKAKNKHKTYIYDRRKRLKKNYGLTLDDYNTMLLKQNNKCLICGEKAKKALAIDHCHSTNKIRGLLCGKCNTHLGWYEKFKNKIQEYLK